MQKQLQQRQQLRQQQQFFQGNCACCGNCPSCATDQFTDDFSSTLGGYTNVVCAADAGTWTTASGSISIVGGAAAGSRYQSVTRPALSGLCISVQADVFTGSATNGVYIDDARFFFARWTFANYGRVNIAASCPTTGFTIIGGTLTTGVTIKMTIQDTSSGGGTYSITYCVNGNTIATETGVSLTIPDPFIAGIRGTNGGSWDNLVISTN